MNARPLAQTHDFAPAAIRYWLLAVAGLIVLMVVVGGATRLTDSGLSITEWKPIHGVIPPLSDAEWQEEFAKYQKIPEYELINKGMSLSEFKGIFWWEWGHRFLGRFIGIAFFVPMVWFWARGQVPGWLKPRLVALLLLGGLQGAVGWWMVASGLVDRVDVSQYRLAVHLTLACSILAAIVWTAESLKIRAKASLDPAPHGLAPVARAIVALVLLQIFLGGLVAGLDAGFTYNTWPLMDGSMVPSGLLFQDPWWINAFENTLTVQFDHRILAYLIVVCVLLQWWWAARRAPESRATMRSALLAGVVIAQAAIGIVTLLLVVPLKLGLLHQFAATVVLWIAVVHARWTVAEAKPASTVLAGEGPKPASTVLAGEGPKPAAV
ncbi:COX15/CtaA family protein [Amorphus sp. 3PC139-8]|uniref:COX15/CtaA family protein n=1 Tax=Amorphus sp. 3PC139-8 TaxID=2735676 RepID=UPI00345CECBA